MFPVIHHEDGSVSLNNIVNGITIKCVNIRLNKVNENNKGFSDFFDFWVEVTILNSG